MFMQKSGNPTLRAFESPNYADLAQSGHQTAEEARAAAGQMTLSGTILKTGLLLAMCGVSAVMVWKMMTVTGGMFGVSISPMLALAGGGIGGFLLGLVIAFVPKLAPVLSTPYAALQGAFVAGLSLFVAERWLGGIKDPAVTGVIFQAVVLTFAICAAMLIAYGTGIIKGGKVFTAVVVTGSGGLMLYVAALWIGNGIFGAGIPNLYDSAGPIGIGFTAISLLLASMFLVLDFKMIDQGVQRGAPKHMEWYGAFSLLVTLVWIYIEVLRLLAKLRSNN